MSVSAGPENSHAPLVASTPIPVEIVSSGTHADEQRILSLVENLLTYIRQAHEDRHGNSGIVALTLVATCRPDLEAIYAVKENQ